MPACRECYQPIIFVEVFSKRREQNSNMPVDPRPNPEGNVAVLRDPVDRRLRGRVLGRGSEPGRGEVLYMPHKASCPVEARLRAQKAAQPQSSVAQQDAWRAAEVRHAAGKRSRRASRPQPPITGVRHNPRGKTR